ncbi:MAG: cation:proton antiporter [Chitinivibrionia bacterium]|nr:cation:proton antiporter [Chitinivibrionia bacterium]
MSLITIASLSWVVLKKLKFSYSIGLVIVGLIVGVIANVYQGQLNYVGIRLSYDVVLYLILPILIFDAALNVNSKVLFKNMVPIALLLVVGVLVSAFVIGGLLSWTMGFYFGAMLLFGIIISAVDPVAILALFNEVGAPKRLRAIIEGESMSNDSTVIVLFSIVLALTYHTPDITLSIPTEILRMIKILFGGTAVGIVVGFVGAFFCKMDKDGREYQIILSIIMAYSSFIGAETLHLSGVMAALSAGVVFSLKAEDVIRRRNREQVETFWEFFTFIANSFIFLLMGITQANIFIESQFSAQAAIAVPVSIAILIFARYLSVMTCFVPYNFFVRKRRPELRIPHSYSLIFTWGALRGAFPAALVLTIPLDYPLRDIIVQLTFSYILFSLLVQGTSVKELMKKLKIEPDDPDIDESTCSRKLYSFPNNGIVDLIISKVVKHCEEEGFYVRTKTIEEYPDKEHIKEYVMKMRDNLFLFRVTNHHIEVLADQGDISYANTIIYETIIELNQSLSSIVEVMKPDSINQIIREDDEDNETNFDFMKYLCKNCMAVPLINNEKNAAIRELTDIMQINGKFASRQDVFDAVIEREKSMSTGLGEGVAFPHARTDAVETICAAIGISHKGIEFGAIDKKPVYIVVVILSPTKDCAPHLQFLAEMSKVLSKPEVREKFINAKNNDELYKILEERDW